MGLNPLNALKESAENLKKNMEAISITSRDQTTLIKRQVEDVAKQTLLLERWANAAEAQIEILQGILDELKGRGKNRQ